MKYLFDLRLLTFRLLKLPNGIYGDIVMRRLLGYAFLSLIILSGAVSAQDAPQKTSENDLLLKRYFKANPDADTDKDGVLSKWEYDQHLPAAILKQFAASGNYIHADIKLRDGHSLPAEIFLPSKEGGPWPVILCRAEYGRWGTGRYAKGFGEKGFVFIAVDNRQWDKGKHKVWQEPESSFHEIEDGRDILDWISKQSWCSGKIGTVGGSGNAFASVMMIWADHPNFTVNGAGNTAGNIKYYWCFHNGVRRGTSYNWITNREAPKSGNIPTVSQTEYNIGKWRSCIREKGKDCSTWYFNSTGWFDPMVQGAIDDFTALQNTGRAFVTVRPSGHGGVSGLPGDLKSFPFREPADKPQWAPSMEQILKGETGKQELKSTLKYYLMGDLTDPAAPGNIWQYTHVWPVPHTDTSWYLHKDGSLRKTLPESEDGILTYTYNPQDPAPTIGGHHSWSGKENGPWDQRPLRERKDVLYFVTDQLTEPAAITGNIRMALSFSSTAPDTAFIVKLIDIYPDGFEFLVRESAGMGRFASGYASPAPLEKGKVYNLDIDMWSSAIVFNKGHRIGVIVTSSSKKAYQVHPNSFEPVTDVSESVSAENTIHCSKEHSSELILPVIPVP